MDTKWNVAPLFKQIAQQDFPLSGPGLNGELFLFNLSRKLYLHMYDDRGADIYAVNPSTLNPIRENFFHLLMAV